jgi:hypothetical protein
MNNRIQELAVQAYELCSKRTYGTVHSQEEFNQKFAKLIVRECVSIAGQEDFDVMMKEGYPCSQTAKKIQEHFGVD